MRSLFVVVVTSLLLSGGAVRADYLYQFVDVSPQNNPANTAAATAFAFDATAGPLVLKVYLAQTGDTFPSTGLSDSGVRSAGVSFTYDNTVVKTSNAGIALNSGTGNEFSTGNKNVSTSGGTDTAAANVTKFGAPVAVSTTGADANRVLIGTFTFSGLSPNTTSLITFNATGSQNVLGDGTVIDDLINYNSATITVTAVPEPGSLILTGLIAAGIGGAALRRRKKASAVA